MVPKGAFSYHGKKQIARRIIENIALYVIFPENETGFSLAGSKLLIEKN